MTYIHPLDPAYMNDYTTVRCDMCNKFFSTRDLTDTPKGSFCEECEEKRREEEDYLNSLN